MYPPAFRSAFAINSASSPIESSSSNRISRRDSVFIIPLQHHRHPFSSQNVYCLRSIRSVSGIFSGRALKGTSFSKSFTRTSLQIATASPLCRRARYSHSIYCGATASSASTKHTYSPFACSSPLLRAEDTPPFFLCRVRMRESFSAYLSMISGLPSDEPSFIRSSSKFEYVCVRRLSMQRGSSFSTL